MISVDIYNIIEYLTDLLAIYVKIEKSLQIYYTNIINDILLEKEFIEFFLEFNEKEKEKKRKEKKKW